MQSIIALSSATSTDGTQRNAISCQGHAANASRTFSERNRKKREEWAGKTVSRVTPQNLTFLLMKDKFERIYKDIQRIALKDQHIPVKIDRRQAARSKMQTEEELNEEDQQQRPTLTVSSLHLTPAQHPHSQPRPTHSQIHTKNTFSSDSESGVLPSQVERRRARGSSVREQMRKSRYRKRVLDPISADRLKLSNNIKDYLSVQKIFVRDPEQSQPSRVKILKKSIEPTNNLQTPQVCQLQVFLEPPKQKRVQQLLLRRGGGKFKPPFPLYYYRDFMWKVAYSHQFMVEPVQDYDIKFKYFVGAGNNSNLIKGLMRRRPWFQITEKPQDSHFVWTQIKITSIFTLQKKVEVCQSMAIHLSLPVDQPQSIFNASEQHKWKDYWSKNMEKERVMKDGMRVRTRIFNAPLHQMQQVRGMRVHNHFNNNFLIGNKKALFQTMREYYSARGEQVFDYLPLTFHIKNGLEDDQYLHFLQHYYAIAKENKVGKGQYPHNAWIVKPGENTNRGNGIIVCLELGQMKAMLRKKERHGDGSYKTYILQKYIERPLLYRRRKFDLRHYIMLTSFHGCRKGYWYRHGYVRTTSAEYSLSGTAGAVHLTNDAVQKTLPDYGRYQKGNKITYEDLDAFLKKNDPEFDFFRIVYPQMRAIASSVIRASATSLDPERRSSNFEIFGLDFMVDADYRVWLIQVNTNPCLQTTCPVLSQVIPTLLEHAFQICIDPLFPAPLSFSPSYQPYYNNMVDNNGFQLVYDERIDGASSCTGAMADELREEEQVFDDDGEDFED